MPIHPRLQLEASRKRELAAANQKTTTDFPKEMKTDDSTSNLATDDVS